MDKTKQVITCEEDAAMLRDIEFQDQLERYGRISLAMCIRAMAKTDKEREKILDLLNDRHAKVTKNGKLGGLLPSRRAIYIERQKRRERNRRFYQAIKNPPNH